MKNATILAIQGSSGTQDELKPLVTASVAHGGRLSVLFAGSVPRLPSYAAGPSPFAIPVVPDTWVTQRNELVDKLSGKQAETRAMLQGDGLTGEVSVVCVEPATLHEHAAQRALFADFCVVQNSLRSEKHAFKSVVYGLLFEGPGPMLLNANANTFSPKHAMIAWNETVPAARAVRAALPLLKAADEVTIACFDPKATRWADGESPGADLASWLSHHGCRITVQEYPTGGKPIADALLERATEQAVDLVVMGAYGRSRLNEHVFGGTTVSMTKQEKIAVLMAH